MADEAAKNQIFMQGLQSRMVRIQDRLYGSVGNYVNNDEH